MVNVERDSQSRKGGKGGGSKGERDEKTRKAGGRRSLSLCC